MVLADRTTAMDTMPQTVPSAGFTPPCDYSNFADNFDLSLLPGGDSPPISPSTTLFYPSLLEKPSQQQQQTLTQPKIFTTFYPSSPENQSLTSDNEFVVSDFQPDFQKLLGDSNNNNNNNNNNKKYLSPHSPIHLEVTTNSFNQNSNSGSLSPYSPNSHGLLSPNDQYSTYREQSFYPSSPEYSLYTPSPGSYYSKSPSCDEFLQGGYLKQEETLSNSTSPIPSFSPFGIKEENYLTSALSVSSPVSPSNSNYSSGSNPSPDDVLKLFDPDKQIKQESTVDFSELFNLPQTEQTHQQSSPIHHLFESKSEKPSALHLQTVPEETAAPKQDHQLLRQVLRDTSFQKKYNIHPIDFPFAVNGNSIKMENPQQNEQDDLIMSCEQQISRESIEPVLNLAIEQMRKDVTETCSVLGISPDPTAWSASDVLSWIRWTSRQYLCPEPSTENWNITGSELQLLSEKDFINRAPQGGMILYAQLEIWKAAYSEEKNQAWQHLQQQQQQQQQQQPESLSENASSGGDASEDEDDEMQPPSDPAKPTTSRASSNIHLWQFLRELLSNPQTHGSCIRWLDRGKGIFKIEDSVKVATLWGKRKNRPAMNYDKLSRSIRQYYKKGIMKKTERSQRLVYQFCHVDKL